MDMNKEIKLYQDKLKKFAIERDWEQFHSPKNIASALSVEASELLEIFQWLTNKESNELNEKQMQCVREEIADVFFYLFRLSDIWGIDISNSLDEKFIKNVEKYPVNLVKGSSKKYDEY